MHNPSSNTQNKTNLRRTACIASIFGLITLEGPDKVDLHLALPSPLPGGSELLPPVPLTKIELRLYGAQKIPDEVEDLPHEFFISCGGYCVGVVPDFVVGSYRALMPANLLNMAEGRQGQSRMPEACTNLSFQFMPEL